MDQQLHTPFYIPTVSYTHLKIWADEPEMIEAKYQEIQELYPQIGFCIGKNLSGLLTDVYKRQLLY